jgi:hypothetical protein
MRCCHHLQEWAEAFFKMVSRLNGGVAMEKKVLNAMKKAGKPVRPGEVAKMLGEDSKQVSKAINELKKQGKIVSPKRCFWEPA